MTKLLPRRCNHGGIGQYGHETIITFPWRIQSSNDLEHSKIALVQT